jgi:hypothetical protein
LDLRWGEQVKFRTATLHVRQSQAKHSKAKARLQSAPAHASARLRYALANKGLAAHPWPNLSFLSCDLDFASRWPQRLSLAASIRRSISRSVRCSRDRYAALGLRTGKVTVRFSEAGRTTFRCRIAVPTAKPPNDLATGSFAQHATTVFPHFVSDAPRESRINADRIRRGLQLLTRLLARPANLDRHAF